MFIMSVASMMLAGGNVTAVLSVTFLVPGLPCTFCHINSTIRGIRAGVATGYRGKTVFLSCK